MRAGPSLDVLAGGVGVGVEVSSVRGDVVLATSIPVDAVKIEATASRTVPTQVTFNAPPGWVPTDPRDALGNFGQRVQVVYLVDDHGRLERIPLGWYLIASWNEGTDTVQVTALDLLQTLEENPFAWGSSPAAGATLRTECQRLAGTLPVILDDGVDDVSVSPKSQWGTSRTEAVRDLCAAKGVGYRVGADACLHLYPLGDGSRPVAQYTATDLLVDAPRSSVDRRPNRIYVTGTHTESVTRGKETVEVETKWTGTATATAEPYDPDTYGWVTDHREFSSATSRSQVQAAAETYMRNAVSATTSRSLEIVADPRIELGDVISAVVTHPDGPEFLTGRVTAYSLPVGDPAGTMRIDIEEMTW
ncbi:hypothetical protein [Actinomyces sp. MRS3W]|uniref:hypothetical protein n=1 Tax=Actinomyces sp. MRS3W TaxID=2800796 RepID=UPI0028FD385C|nr:hypothetical protein [Actinomyces sp. MRS3W]MDU0347491.1 hypothetical protein [Actinomyces sp. MRS3W]